MKRFFGLLNLLLIIAVLAWDVRYIQHGTLRIKTITSMLFTSIGAVNLVYAFAARTKKLYPAVILAGLCFAMAGDIGLHYSFVRGAMLFGLGHVLYLISFCILMKPKTADLLPFAILFIGASVLLLGYKRFHFGSTAMRNICLVYAFIISLMTGKAVSNFIRCRNALFAIAAIGSILFFVSDLMLALYKFARMPHYVDTLCLAFYYPGQCVLGLSTYMCVRRAAKP